MTLACVALLLGSCREEFDISVEEENPHSVRVAVDRSRFEEGAVQALCVSAEADDEHRADWLESGETWLHGLLAATDYACSLVVDGATAASFDFATPQEVALPQWQTTGDLAGAGTYTLFNVLLDGLEANEQWLVIIDPLGRVRWTLPIDKRVSGDVDASLLAEQRILFGGGYGQNPTVVDLAGEVVYAQDDPPFGDWHHHAALTEDGYVLAIAESLNGDGDREWTGFLVRLTDPATGDVVWEYDSQTGFERGDLPGGSGDAYHANSASVVGDGVRVSLRDTNQIIDLDAEVLDVRWTFGWGGDFTQVDEEGEPVAEDWPRFQHDPEYQGDRVLLYDNGAGVRDGRTRVAEFELDESAMTATLLWEYREPEWLESVWGDADRLSNGDVLITYGHCLGCAQSNPDARSALVQVDPETDEVAWRVDFPSERVGMYRAERLDACDIFANVAYCP